MMPPSLGAGAARDEEASPAAAAVAAVRRARRPGKAASWADFDKVPRLHRMTWSTGSAVLMAGFAISPMPIRRSDQPGSDPGGEALQDPFAGREVDAWSHVTAGQAIAVVRGISLDESLSMLALSACFVGPMV